MDCSQICQHMDCYADGELEPSDIIDFESHLARCAVCRDELRVLQATRQALREQLVGVRAPASLRLAVERKLDSVDGREGASRRWVGTAVAASAAAVLLGWGNLSNGGSGLAGNPSQASIQSGLMPIFEDVVERHRDDLPPEVEPTEGPERVAGWFRDKVGFRVEPVRFDRPEVRLLGARMSHVRTQRAAKLVYRWGDRRVTMVVFPSMPELTASLRPDQDSSGVGIRRERFGGRVITYYTVQNYTVPIIEHNGIAYAFTGDLDRTELLQLVGSARLP